MATLLLGIGKAMSVLILSGMVCDAVDQGSFCAPFPDGGVPKLNIDALITLDYGGSHPIGGDCL